MDSSDSEENVGPCKCIPLYDAKSIYQCSPHGQIAFIFLFLFVMAEKDVTLT